MLQIFTHTKDHILLIQIYCATQINQIIAYTNTLINYRFQPPQYKDIIKLKLIEIYFFFAVSNSVVFKYEFKYFIINMNTLIT